MSANSTALDNNEYITPRNRVREISPITIKTAEVDDQTKLILFKNLNLIKKTEEESPASRPAEEMREEELIPEDTLPLEEIISPEKEFIPVETPTLPGITVVDTSQEVKDRVLKNINTYTTSHISYDTTNYSAEEIIEVTKETIFKEITPYFVAIRSMIAEYDSAARNSHRQSFLKATILENIVYLQARLGNLLCDHFLKKNIIVPIDLVRKFFTNARSQYIPVNFRAIAGVANTPESSFLGAVSYASVLYNAERLKKLTVHRLESREDLNFFDLHHGTDMIIFDNPQYLPSKQTPAAVYLLDVKT